MIKKGNVKNIDIESIKNIYKSENKHIPKIYSVPVIEKIQKIQKIKTRDDYENMIPTTFQIHF